MLSHRFESALSLAFRLHAGQTRKGNQIPYIAHLMSVTSLVLENGGDEDQAIAALLHDAVEDQGGLETLELIRREYGDRVARIVDGCTDAYILPKPPWQERKQIYLEHLNTAGDEIRLVSLADKLHNARSILVDLQKDGVGTLERFRGGREGTLWYYHSLVDVFRQRECPPMLDELEHIINEIDQMVRSVPE